MEKNPSKKSSFVNVVAWLMMGFGGFGLLITGFQLFFFLFVLPDDFAQEMMSPDSGLFIDRYLNFMFSHLPALIGLLILGNLLQIVVGLGLWKRWRWAWMASIAVFVVLLLGTIALGIFQQIFYSIMFAEIPEAGAGDGLFVSFQWGIRALAGFMMLAMAVLWIWIIYRLSRSELKQEFV